MRVQRLPFPPRRLCPRLPRPVSRAAPHLPPAASLPREKITLTLRAIGLAHARASAFPFRRLRLFGEERTPMYGPLRLHCVSFPPGT